jgi:guanylate kinase
MRAGEADGREYFFTDEQYVRNLEDNNRIIELRAYNTVHGVWKYFTADDGQIDKNSDNKYLIIATVEAYEKYVKYYGNDMIVPIYIEVDNKTRIHRALAREDAQNDPKYAEMCRRFLADEQDFSDERLEKAGIVKRYNNINLNECIYEITNDILKS